MMPIRNQISERKSKAETAILANSAVGTTITTPAFAQVGNVTGGNVTEGNVTEGNVTAPDLGDGGAATPPVITP